MTEVSPTTKNLLSIRPVQNKDNKTNTVTNNSVANRTNTTTNNSVDKTTVYIYDKQGKLTDAGKWDPMNNGNVVGVALITNKIRVLISLHNVGGKEKYVWGPDGMVDGVPSSTSNSNSNAGNILSDYDGKGNTMKLMNSLYPSTKTALYKASNYVFPNGEKGYLPALGEIIEVFRNIESINAALLKAGGEIIENDWYWTSSLHMQKYRAWSIAGYSLEYFANLRNGSSPLAKQYGAAYMYVRPFGSIDQ